MLQDGLNNNMPVQILFSPISRMRTESHEETGNKKRNAANHQSPHEIDRPCRPTVLGSHFVIVAVIERSSLEKGALPSYAEHSKTEY
jgi:hypothetical protein